MPDSLHGRSSDATARETRRLSWLTVMLFWLASLSVGVLSITPVERLPAQVFDVWDKAQHAAGFLVLTFLGFLAHPPQRNRVVGGLLVYGVAIELAQSATGWRHGDLYDWLADATGVCVAVMVHAVWRRRGDNAQ